MRRFYMVFMFVLLFTMPVFAQSNPVKSVASVDTTQSDFEVAKADYERAKKQGEEACRLAEAQSTPDDSEKEASRKDAQKKCRVWQLNQNKLRRRMMSLAVLPTKVGEKRLTKSQSAQIKVIRKSYLLQQQRGHAACQKSRANPADKSLKRDCTAWQNNASKLRKSMQKRLDEVLEK